MRFTSVGMSEPEWWTYELLPKYNFSDPSAPSSVATMKILGGWLAADKIDWLLLSHDLSLAPGTTWQSDGDQDASDHSYVVMDIQTVE